MQELKKNKHRNSMDTYGLIGKKLTHSFSKPYFEKKFANLGIKAQYLNYEVSNVQHIKRIIDEDPTIIGLNVTIPFKKDVFEIVDKVDPIALESGAINTLKIDREGNDTVITAYNTDVIGFQYSLEPLIVGREKISALVLGTGGAASAVVYVLQKLGIPYISVSRTPINKGQINYDVLSEEIVRNHQLIINTTPVGMFPHVDQAPPIPYQYLDHNHILYDLIYNPAETLFLKRGHEKSCTTMNGLRMLKMQAEASWNIWID